MSPDQLLHLRDLAADLEKQAAVDDRLTECWKAFPRSSGRFLDKAHRTRLWLAALEAAVRELEQRT